MIKRIKNVNLFLYYALAVFVYTYSGVVGKYPDYNANALLTYFFVSACAAVFAFAVSVFFTSDFENGNKIKKIFPVLLFAFCALYTASDVCFFAYSIRLFDDYYSQTWCMAFSAGAALLCGAHLARRGKNAVTSFCILSSALFAAWTFFGLFAFFTAENALSVSSPLSLLEKTRFSGIIKDILYLNADLAVLAFVLSKNESKERRQTLKKAIPAGVFAFIAVSGINVLKNLLLFGDKLSDDAQNPNFTAIRMIPLFDLPEICVIVSAFACIIKICVSACAALFAIKEIKKEKYNDKKTTAVFVSLSALLLLFSQSAIFGYAQIISAVACAALCFAIKRENG